MKADSCSTKKQNSFVTLCSCIRLAEGSFTVAGKFRCVKVSLSIFHSRFTFSRFREIKIHWTLALPKETSTTSSSKRFLHKLYAASRWPSFEWRTPVPSCILVPEEYSNDNNKKSPAAFCKDKLPSSLSTRHECLKEERPAFSRSTTILTAWN